MAGGRPPKITVVCGGVFTSLRLAEQLAKQDCLHRIVTTWPPRRGEVIPRARLRWNPIPELLMRSGLPNGHYLKAVTFGKWAARQVGCGDLLVCWAQFGLESIRKARTFGIPSVVVRQSLHVEAQREILGLPRTRLVDRELEEYALADRIEIPTTLARQSFLDRGFPVDKLLLIPPVGADPAVFHPESGNAANSRIGQFQALVVGVSQRKGTRFALEACKQAGVNAWVVGRPEHRVRLQEGLLSDSGGSSLEWLGPLPQRRLADFYQRASVVIIASLEEGLPHVLVESLASGCPVITTTSSGAADVITHGREGWLVLPMDVEMMAEYLVRLKANEPLRAKMSAAAAETGKHWTWSAYGERAVRAYTMVLEGGGWGLPLHSPPNPP